MAVGHEMEGELLDNTSRGEAPGLLGCWVARQVGNQLDVHLTQLYGNPRLMRCTWPTGKRCVSHTLLLLRPGQRHVERGGYRFLPSPLLHFHSSSDTTPLCL